MFSWQNLEVCLKWKNNLVFEWNQKPDPDEIFFFLGGGGGGGFFFFFWGGGEFQILEVSHRFRLSFISISFTRDLLFRAEILPFLSSLQLNVRLKSPSKTICLLEISMSSSIFCKIEKVFNCSDSALDL